MDTTQSSTQDPPNDSPFQFHLSTLVAVCIVFGLLLGLNLYARTVQFQNVEVKAYGFPLLVRYAEPTGDVTKLDPPVQFNWITLYYDIFICTMILVCSGALISRMMQRRDQTADVPAGTHS